MLFLVSIFILQKQIYHFFFLHLLLTCIKFGNITNLINTQMKKTFTFLFLLFCMCCFYAQTPYAIGHHSEDPGYLDVSRNRDVFTEIYYPANIAGDDVPAANGQFPVIVFGHGFVIRWDAYDFIWEYFVAKGYICAFLRTEGNTSPSHTDFGGDMAFLATYIPTVLNTSDPILQGHVKNKTAIMGHSMGGGSSYLACANNATPTTFISLAAATTNPSSITAAANISVPSLTIAGTEDCVAPIVSSGSPANALAMYNALPSSTCKYFVELTGASHCQFTYGSGGGGAADLCYSGEGLSCLFGWGPYITLQQQHDRMFLLIEPWLRYYLQNDCSGWTDYLANLSTLNSSNAITQELHSCSVSIPIAPIITPPAAICEGQSTTLTATGGGTSSYSWSNGTVGVTTTVNTAGNYTATMNNGTCTITSAPVTLVVNSAPAIPTITQNGNTLSTSAMGVSYQWYVNGQVVATTQSFSPTTNGTYTLTVTNLSNSCNASSTPFNFVISAISPALYAYIQLFPNPSQDLVNVQIQLENSADLKIDLLDLQGKMLMSWSLTGKDAYNSTLSVEKYPEGMYFLKISGEKGMAIHRVMKE
jgi:pimeloyl-ACP methyl ester carboxylesterase